MNSPLFLVMGLAALLLVAALLAAAKARRRTRETGFAAARTIPDDNETWLAA